MANRIVFGPHATNLGIRRSLSDAHVAYYRRRAEGGVGLLVTEEASVLASDWPYERAPLAADCGPGWAAVAEACHGYGTAVLAALGHSGGQGSSAFNGGPLWAPSQVPDPTSREAPKVMDDGDVQDLVDGFSAAARTAVHAGVDGVEINAGQHSLLRQYLSGLTNRRDDRWGRDRRRLLGDVIDAVRAAVGAGAAVVLRLSVDELAPWGGITPDEGVATAAALAPGVDGIVVTRGGAMSVAATRPDGHTPPGWDLDVAGRVRAAVPAAVAVIAQGSIVDGESAAAALSQHRVDAIEMTRALIADPGLPAAWAAGHPERVRPCLLCNQACCVRQPRNPVVTCVLEPASGHEQEPSPPDTVPPDTVPPDTGRPAVLIVGGGPAGLECARVAAISGWPAVVAEARAACGGLVRAAAAAAGRERLALGVDWLEAECRRLGVIIDTGRALDVADLVAHRGPVVVCTGSRPGLRRYRIGPDGQVTTALEVLAGAALRHGPAVVWDPLGGPIGVSVAESLAGAGHQVTFLTPDVVVGRDLASTGDLVAANARLARAGVSTVTRSELVSVEDGAVNVEDRFTGTRQWLPAGTLVDAGPRLPADDLWRAARGVRSGMRRAGDAVAPRTILEAVLEGRRAALALQER